MRDISNQLVSLQACGISPLRAFLIMKGDIDDESISTLSESIRNVWTAVPASKHRDYMGAGHRRGKGVALSSKQ